VIRSVSSFIKLVHLYDRIPIWLTSSIPIAILIVLSVVLTTEAARTDNYLYRIIYNFTASSFICIFAIYAVSCLLFIRSTLNDATSGFDYASAVFSEKYKKLFQSGIMLTILSILGIAFSVVNLNVLKQGITFTRNILPQDVSVYEPFTYYLIHVIAALAVFYNIWLPLKPQETKVTTTNVNQSTNQNI
jgi:hypothetical protein